MNKKGPTTGLAINWAVERILSETPATSKFGNVVDNKDPLPFRKLVEYTLNVLELIDKVKGTDGPNKGQSINVAFKIAQKQDRLFDDEFIIGLADSNYDKIEHIQKYDEVHLRDWVNQK